MSDIKQFPKWPLYITLLVALIIGLYYSFGMLKAVTSRHRADSVGPFKVEFSHRGEQSGSMPARVNLIVTSEAKPKEIKIAFYVLTTEEARPIMVHKLQPPHKDKKFTPMPMLPAGDTGFYTVLLPPLKMASQYYYYFILTDDNGNSFYYPANESLGLLMNSQGEYISCVKPLNITYRGEGVGWVTALHIAMMAMIVLFLLHTIYYALMHIATPAFPVMKTVLSVFWANLFFFITSFPIGCYVAWKAYGMPWTGIPEVLDPNDVDNKSLLIFIYWVVILILIKGVNSGRNKIPGRTFAWLSLLGAVATVWLFLSGGHN